MPKIRCNNCTNEYKEEDLTLLMEDTSNSDTYYKGCPVCLTDQYLMDLDK